MHKHRAWLVEGLPPPGIEPQTQVDVVEGDREVVLVKATDLREPIGPHDKTGGGHGRDELRQRMAAMIALIFRPEETVRVRGRSAYS